ncbi:MAG: septum formation protein Maf [Candidatus Pacebacteria bacterium]|nr:septum formation protein Maf [Candidatus Paceibacterota bacterium]
MKRKIIIASGSESRKKLVKSIGFNFLFEKSEYKKDMTEKLSARKLAQKLALGKAQDVAQKHPNAIIIGIDSFVILDDEFLGKPHTPQEARVMLKKMSGKKHESIAGIAIIDTKNEKVVTDYETTGVWINKLTDKEIEDYVRTGEPLNKAGSYAIQKLGCILIDKIDGNYTNVLGLPVNKLYKHLIKLGVNILEEPYCKTDS